MVLSDTGFSPNTSHSGLLISDEIQLHRTQEMTTDANLMMTLPWSLLKHQQGGGKLQSWTQPQLDIKEEDEDVILLPYEAETCTHIYTNTQACK